MGFDAWAALVMVAGALILCVGKTALEWRDRRLRQRRLDALRSGRHPAGRRRG